MKKGVLITGILVLTLAAFMVISAFVIGGIITATGRAAAQGNSSAGQDGTIDALGTALGQAIGGTAVMTVGIVFLIAGGVALLPTVVFFVFFRKRLRGGGTAGFDWFLAVVNVLAIVGGIIICFTDKSAAVSGGIMTGFAALTVIYAVFAIISGKREKSAVASEAAASE